MVENRPFLTALSHFIVLLGLAIIAFPVWMTFVASTHSQQTMLQAPIPLLPGPHLLENYAKVLTEGYGKVGSTPVMMTLTNSLIMALGVAIGKIAISIISAFAIVYFRFPGRMYFFWAIFVTLMLPVEVRIVPTYGVVASLGMLDSYSGLIIPLIASATATFLFRQFFLTVPERYQLQPPQARLKLSHTTNGIQVAVLNEEGTALAGKTSGLAILESIHGEL